MSRIGLDHDYHTGNFPDEAVVDQGHVLFEPEIRIRLEKYLACLPLTKVQHLWIRGQVVSRLRSVDLEGEARYAYAFTSLQLALGELAGGDDLDARVNLSLNRSLGDPHVGKPVDWLRQQVSPPIVRSSMASLPLNRSWGAALLRSLRPGRRPEQS